MPEGRYTCPIILNRFGLVEDDCLTNAGEVLFGTTHPVTLKAGIFATEEKLTILDMQMYEDNIYNLLITAEEYILKNIRWKSDITDIERKEIPEIPIAVIREVLANGFAHAIYNGRTNHEICIHPGKITVYSPGEYASKHSPEEYIQENLESEIRNTTISKILYLNKSIEQFGSGFKRIHSLCNDAGIEYSYENTINGFKFILYRPQLQSDIQGVTLDVTLNDTEMSVLAYKGAIFENLMADFLSKAGKKLYYFRKDSGLEIDFVTRYEDECTLVEVKAVTGNAKSVKTILKHPEKYHVYNALKFGDYNVGRDGQTLTLPLYMGALIQK